jgi:hypothetical protein
LNTIIRATEAERSIETTLPEQQAIPESPQTKQTSEERRIHLDGTDAFYKLRSKWSWFILSCIFVLILFQIAITLLVGLDILNFKEYKWFLPLVITENFVQIIGLAIIVVKFLFNDPSKK